MKLLFMTVEKYAKAENINPYKAQVQCSDGNHPIENTAIFRDRRNRLPAIMIIWQNRKTPEGVTDEEIAVDAILAETDYIKIHKQKPSVSKRWVRSFVYWLRVFLLFIVITGATACLLLLLYAVLKVVVL